MIAEESYADPKMRKLRNTPDRDTRLSPAEVLYGRQLRDFLPLPPPSTLWKNLAQMRERALCHRSTKDREKWNEHTSKLPPLRIGDHVFIQNVTGNHPKRWDEAS